MFDVAKERDAHAVAMMCERAPTAVSERVTHRGDEINAGFDSCLPDEDEASQQTQWQLRSHTEYKRSRSVRQHESAHQATARHALPRYPMLPYQCTYQANTSCANAWFWYPTPSETYEYSHTRHDNEPAHLKYASGHLRELGVLTQRAVGYQPVPGKRAHEAPPCQSGGLHPGPGRFQCSSFPHTPYLRGFAYAAGPQLETRLPLSFARNDGAAHLGHGTLEGACEDHDMLNSPIMHCNDSRHQQSVYIPGGPSVRNLDGPRTHGAMQQFDSAKIDTATALLFVAQPQFLADMKELAHTMHAPSRGGTREVEGNKISDSAFSLDSPLSNARDIHGRTKEKEIRKENPGTAKASSQTVMQKMEEIRTVFQAAIIEELQEQSKCRIISPGEEKERLLAVAAIARAHAVRGENVRKMTKDNMFSRGFLGLASKQGFSKEAHFELFKAFFDMILHPYPSSSEFRDIAERANLEYGQTVRWFQNMRKRLWKPVVLALRGHAPEPDVTKWRHDIFRPKKKNA